MQYTVLSDVIRHSAWRKEYTYTVSELVEFSASTNYYKDIKKAIWYAEYNNKWCAEQTNILIRWTDFIPIVNILIAYLRHRKYNIFCNDICVGRLDQVREKGKIWKKIRFIIHEQEYFVCNGNTNVIRPWKNYEWTIESSEGKVFAIARKPFAVSKTYNLEVVGELPIEILVMMIMMCDVHWFSGEDANPITSADFR